MNAVLKPPLELESYGAAELKAVARRHLSRALATGSAAWLLAFLVLALVAVRLVPPPNVVPTVVTLIPSDPSTSIVPPPLVPHTSVVRQTGVVPHPAGDIVPDMHVDPPVVTPNPGSGPADPGSTDGPTGGTRVDPMPGPPALPGPNDYVPHDVEPAPILRVEPKYPELAIMAQQEGVVVIHALVDRNGSVVRVEVARSVQLLDEAAADAIRRWRFSPALDGGHPVAVWISIPVRFSLH
jgi:protein TonB